MLKRAIPVLHVSSSAAAEKFYCAGHDTITLRQQCAQVFRIAPAGLFLVLSACRPPVDIAAATRDLLATDRAWSAVADANGPVDSVVAYWTADARVILTGQPVVVGTAAIREMIAGTRAIPGFHIAWTPDSAVVSPSGDFGYTYGTNRITAPDSTGVLRTAIGRYITVWRKEADGRWRCSFDISNEGPLPAS